MLTGQQALGLARLQEQIYRCVEHELKRGDWRKPIDGSVDIALTLEKNGLTISVRVNS